MFYKKFMIVMMSVLMIAQPFMNMGCSQKSTEPVPAVQTPEPTKDPTIVKMEQQFQLYEATIAKMDKYVTTNNDGTYTLDYQGFLSADGQNLTADEQKVAEGLKEGIPTVNAQILQERKEPGSTALGSACWFYWWGKRCCYWDADGWKIVAALGIVGSAGAKIFPIIGAVSGALSAYLGFYMSVYGGFCINISWIGNSTWVTRP